MIRRILQSVLICIACILVAGIAPAGAQQSTAIRMEVTPFMDGLVKHGEWLPLHVRLENEGADRTVRVAAPVSRSGGGRDVYTQVLELPRGARKEITLYVMPNSFSRRVTVQVLPAEGDTPLLTNDVAVTPIQNIDYTIGIVRGDAAGDGLEPLSSIEIGRSQKRTVNVSLETLPDRFEGLRSLDALLFAAGDTASLTPAQQAALVVWVNRGGVLVVGGGLDAERILAGLPDDLRPAQVLGDTTLDALPALSDFGGEAVRVSGPFQATEALPQSNAVTRLEQNGLPLVIERRVNEGVVYWLALNPADAPFDAWAGTDEFWSILLAPYADYPRSLPPDVSPRRIGDDQLRWALNNLPSLDLPSLRLLVPLLAVYIVAVGPLNYFVLRRRRRLEFAWVTIPAITVAFSVGAYGLGLTARGTNAIVHQISVIEVLPNTDIAVAREYIGLFSPSRSTYRTTFSEDILVESMNNDQFGRPANTSSGNLTVQQGRPTVVEDLDVNQWTMRALAGDVVIHDTYQVESNLVTDGDRVVGTIRNSSTMPIRDAAVAVGSNIQHVGDIAVGESVDVSVASIGSTRPESLSYRLFESGTSGRGNREVEIRRQIVASVYDNPPMWQSDTSRTPAQFVGWVDDGPVSVQVEGLAPQRLQTNFVHVPLPVMLEGEVPVGMIPSRLLTQSTQCFGGQWGTGVQPGGGYAELAFYLPTPAQDGALDLRLDIRQDGGWTAPPKIDVWNTRTSSWDTIADASWQNNRITMADHLAGGEVRVRLSSPDAGRVGGCLYVEMGTTRSG